MTNLSGLLIPPPEDSLCETCLGSREIRRHPYTCGFDPCPDCTPAIGTMTNYNDDARKILDMWSHLEWRHHGTGMLQAYWPGNDDRRVHIWDRRLVLPGMKWSGAMHNHRFHLKSTILFGSLTNTMLHVEEDEKGDCQLWRVTGASAGRADSWVPGKIVRSTDKQSRRLFIGEVYAIPKWGYHWARQESSDTDVTITSVELRDKDYGAFASVVAPFGLVPVDAFSHTPNPVLIADIAEQAHNYLDQMY